MFSRLILAIFLRFLPHIRRLFFSILSGLILYLSWPPNTWSTFLIFISLVPLLIIEMDVTKKKISYFNYFAHTYFAFFIFNLLTTVWIRHAHIGGAFFAILCNAFFMALVLICYSRVKNNIKWKNKMFLLPVLWLSFEYLHLNWDLSWPWLTLGNVFASKIQWIQWYSYTGVLGGSLWIILGNLAFFQLYRNRLVARKFVLNLISAISIILFPLMSSCIFFYFIENNINDNNQSIGVLVVQPNINPYSEKFNNSLSQEDQINNTINLVDRYIDKSTNLLIFPETFIHKHICISDTGCRPSLVGYFHSPYSRYVNLKTKFKKLIKHNSSDLNIIVGASLLEQSKQGAKSKLIGKKWYNTYNIALHYNAYKTDVYRKSKLVPGAEQMPFQNLLYPLLGNQVLQIGSSTMVGNFSTQDSVSIFSSSDGYSVAPIICYESIYGDYVREFVKKGAEAIVVITNDGWWRNTDGYKQHNMYAQLRAIETRRYVVRSANTGISSVINFKGVIENKIDWEVKDVIKRNIQLNNTYTFYVKHGDFLGRLSAFLSVIIVLYFIVLFLMNKLIFHTNKPE